MYIADVRVGEGYEILEIMCQKVEFFVLCSSFLQVQGRLDFLHSVSTVPEDMRDSISGFISSFGFVMLVLDSFIVHH
jgi:hypothetical protein